MCAPPSSSSALSACARRSLRRLHSLPVTCFRAEFCARLRAQSAAAEIFIGLRQSGSAASLKRSNCSAKKLPQFALLRTRRRLASKPEN